MAVSNVGYDFFPIGFVTFCFFNKRHFAFRIGSVEIPQQGCYFFGCDLRVGSVVPLVLIAVFFFRNNPFVIFISAKSTGSPEKSRSVDFNIQ